LPHPLDCARSEGECSGGLALGVGILVAPTPCTYDTQYIQTWITARTVLVFDMDSMHGRF
jgi:hypothetical protein